MHNISGREIGAAGTLNIPMREGKACSFMQSLVKTRQMGREYLRRTEKIQ